MNSIRTCNRSFQEKIRKAFDGFGIQRENSSLCSKCKESLLYAAGLVMSGFLLDGCFCLYKVYLTLGGMNIGTPSVVDSYPCDLWSMKLPKRLNLSIWYQPLFYVTLTHHVRKCE